MQKDNEMMQDIVKYNGAVQAIKNAILQGQYEAAKGVNRIQLAVYFAIGKYISVNTRTQSWGTHALEFISDQLRRELPGLRGFSDNSLKNMRKFYEQWQMLDSNSSVVTAELEDKSNSTIAIVENPTEKPTIQLSKITILQAILISSML